MHRRCFHHKGITSGNSSGPRFVSHVMARLLRIVVGGVLIVAFVIGTQSPASASCAPPLALADAVTSADIVAVGTVTAARNNARIATVTLEDIWKGDPASKIEVAGGPDAANAMTTVDRTYEVGTRYLFFIFEPAAHNSPGTFGARYEDNNCSDTRPYTAELDYLRPASARRVETTTPPSSAANAAPSVPADSGTSAPLVMAALALTIVVAAGFVIAWRTRPRPPRTA